MFLKSKLDAHENLKKIIQMDKLGSEESLGFELVPSDHPQYTSRGQCLNLYLFLEQFAKLFGAGEKTVEVNPNRVQYFLEMDHVKGTLGTHVFPLIFTVIYFLLYVVKLLIGCLMGIAE